MIRGWCPSLFEPMQSGDGLLARIKPRPGGLDADTVRAIADASARLGNGALNLTARANLQLRGLSDATLPALADAMLARGAAHPDPAIERRRNLVTSPLAGDDPRLAPATLATALALEAGLAAPDPVLDTLPGKFGFLVDGGTPGLAATRADIVLRLAPNSSALALDGAPLALAVPPEQAAAAALSLARAFAALAPDLRRDAAPGAPPAHALRMRDLVARLGAPAIFAAAGLPAPSLPANAPAPDLDVGPLRYPGTVRGALAVAPAFGQLEASAFHALAALCEQHGDGHLRLSPSRTLLIAGVPAPDLPRLVDACAALGLITSPADPRLSIATCPGRPACRSGEADTRRDAPALAALLRTRRPGTPVHLSGCAKGCAHPAPAPLTLVGLSGGYGAARDAPASAPPQATFPTIAAAWAWAHPAAPPPGTAP